MEEQFNPEMNSNIPIYLVSLTIWQIQIFFFSNELDRLYYSLGPQKVKMYLKALRKGKHCKAGLKVILWKTATSNTRAWDGT